MFDYDKIIKKLENFNELSGKKQSHVFDHLFSDEFKAWFYGVGEGANDQPMTPTMIDNLFTHIAKPNIIKHLTKYVLAQDRFDHTSCAIAFFVVDEAVEALDKANAEITDDYNAGSINTNDAKEYKKKSEKYTMYILDLLNAIKSKCSDDVKGISKRTNIPKGMVYVTYLLVPDRKYIPNKGKISYYMNSMLKEIYKWVASNGLEGINNVRWGSLFGTYFGSEMTASAAITILLEGVKRIDAHRDSDNFDDVKAVWDSLTVFALNELDNAPDNVRNQMLEIYIKKAGKLYHRGVGPRLRVDLLNVPSRFANLTKSINRYSDQITKITRDNVKNAEDKVTDASKIITDLTKPNNLRDFKELDISVDSAFPKGDEESFEEFENKTNPRKKFLDVDLSNELYGDDDEDFTPIEKLKSSSKKIEKMNEEFNEKKKKKNKAFVDINVKSSFGDDEDEDKEDPTPNIDIDDE